MTCSWKPNWQETKQHFIDWWNHEGLVIGAWYGLAKENASETIQRPVAPNSIEQRCLDVNWRALDNHYRLSKSLCCADTLPIAETNIAPVSLALFLGATPVYTEETVWLLPYEHGKDNPEFIPPLRFDPNNEWWKISEQILQTCAELGSGKYMVGCPDLVENIDVLAALHGTEGLLTDMLRRPAWVKEKICEINQVWLEVYRRIFEIIKLEDGSSAVDYFRLWGPGKTNKVQCDSAAMISPQMFEEFVVPALRQQCICLDWVMYHIDGPDALRHLDILLDIDEIDAIEWTPGPRVPSGGSEEWYPIYRKILESGKSLQLVDINPNEVPPLLDAIGGKGVYIITEIHDEKEADWLLRVSEPFR